MEHPCIHYGVLHTAQYSIIIDHSSDRVVNLARHIALYNYMGVWVIYGSTMGHMGHGWVNHMSHNYVSTLGHVGHMGYV